MRLRSRLERLEAQTSQARRSVVQVGLLRRLPDNFVGERHVVVLKRSAINPPNWQTCEFEEQAGPEPPGVHNDACQIYLSEDDLNL